MYAKRPVQSIDTAADRVMDTAPEASGHRTAGPARPALARAVLSGFIASATMLFAFAIAYTVAALLAVSLDDSAGGPLREWFQGLTSNVLIDLARPNLYTALATYFTGGLVWALLYAYVFHARLRGPAWRRGLVFALVPWLFSLGVFLPLIGGGFLGLALGAGPLPIIGNLILHAVYGATLGEVYGPLWDVSPDGVRGAAADVDLLANRHAASGAATGLLLGLAAGGVVGLAASSASLVIGGGTLLGPSPAVLPLATAILGGALGALAGSYVGLSPAAPRA